MIVVIRDRVGLRRDALCRQSAPIRAQIGRRWRRAGGGGDDPPGRRAGGVQADAVGAGDAISGWSRRGNGADLGEPIGSGCRSRRCNRGLVSDVRDSRLPFRDSARLRRRSRGGFSSMGEISAHPPNHEPKSPPLQLPRFFQQRPPQSGRRARPDRSDGVTSRSCPPTSPSGSIDSAGVSSPRQRTQPGEV